MTVKDVYDLIDRTAPFETQADFDNSGLLVGSASQEINGILLLLISRSRLSMKQFVSAFS